VNTLSLDKPLVADGNFTLLDVLASKPDEFAACDTEPKMKIPQARRSIEIDQDVTDAMRFRFGTMPLGRALRIMLGLKPKVAQNAWQEEEDALIREYYPLWGGPSLAKVMDRSVDCIRERASLLGVGRIWLYKRISQHQVDRHVRQHPEWSVSALVSGLLKRYPLTDTRASHMVGISFGKLGDARVSAGGV